MKSGRVVRLLFPTLLLLLSSGCETLQHPMAPRQSFDTNADILALEEEFGKASSISGYYAGPKTLETRNRFVTGRLALINLHYIQFIRQFAADKAQLDTALDVMQLGVDLSTTVVGGAAVKAALGAASAGITGTRTSVEKNFFFEQTVPALITAMNAQRKEALLPIISGLKFELEDYPFAQAVTDLEAYYFAGTFVGGLQAIQRDAGVKEARLDRDINDIRQVNVVSSTLQVRREAAAAWVKNELDDSQRKTLAIRLGAPAGQTAAQDLLYVLNQISAAESDDDFNVIAQITSILFGREF